VEVCVRVEAWRCTGFERINRSELRLRQGEIEDVEVFALAAGVR
jgi:hypothetical protein